MKPLSIELTTILKKIDNYKIDLEIIKNFKFSESNIRKRYLSQRKTIKNDETSNPSSENANNTEKLKQKDLENFIKMEKVRLHKKKLDIIKKMESLDLKKNNILIKLVDDIIKKMYEEDQASKLEEQRKKEINKLFMQNHIRRKEK